MLIPNTIQQTLSHVRRRLVAQEALTRLGLSLSVALGLACLAVLLEPYVVPANTAYRAWTIAGATVAGVLIALVQTWRRVPSTPATALLVDARFGLCERLTTVCHLSAPDAQSPAGQALLADTSTQVAKLDVPARFPLTLPRTLLAVPAVVVGLLAVLFWYEPQFPTPPAPIGPEAIAANEAKVIDQQARELLQRLQQPGQLSEKSTRPAELDKIASELEKVLNQPRDNTEQARERVKELTELEEALQKVEKQQAEKLQQVKNQLEQLDRMKAKTKSKPPTPNAAKTPDTRALEEALANGDLDAAKTAIDELKQQNQDTQDIEAALAKGDANAVEEAVDRLKKKAKDAATGPAKPNTQALEDALAKGDAQAAQAALDQLKREQHDIKEIEDALTKGDKQAAQDAVDRLKKKAQDPAADLEDALAKGDTEAAREAIDELKKRNQDTKAVEEALAKGDAKAAEEAADQLRKKPKDPQADLEQALAKNDLAAAKQAADELKKQNQDTKTLDEALAKGDQKAAQQAADELKKKADAGEQPSALEDALSKGDVGGAKDAVEQLKKTAKDGSAEAKKQAGEQLDRLQDKLERLSRNQDQQEALQKKIDQLKQQGEDTEALERERDQLKQQAEKNSSVKKLADKFKKAQQSLEQGDNAGAEQALDEAGKQLDELEQEQQQLDETQNQLQRLSSTRDSLAKACKNCKCGGRQPQEDDAETLSRKKDEDQGGSANEKSTGGKAKGQKDQQAQGKSGQQPGGQGGQQAKNGPGGTGVGSGKRPDGKLDNTKPLESKQAGQFDTKGEKSFAGSAPGQAYRKQSTSELAGAIQQATQEAPEAIEVQRIPKAARDMAKGYFKNLGQQTTPPPAKP